MSSMHSNARIPASTVPESTQKCAEGGSNVLIRLVKLTALRGLRVGEFRA